MNLKNKLPSKAFSLVICASLASLAISSEAAVPKAYIAKFDSNRSAAISYTFDDGLRDQYTLAVPMLNEVGFKGTFFVIPGRTSEALDEAQKNASSSRSWGGISWPELKEMAGQGHEIANHTWSHTNLLKLTPEQVDLEYSKGYEAIKNRLGIPPLTLAFPFNASNAEVEAAAHKYHVAYRDYQTGTAGNTTVDSLNSWADKLVGENKWGILMVHGIATGYAALSDPEILRTHFKYVKTHDQKIWVDTFANIARYTKERDTSTLNVTGRDGRVTCVLNSSLDQRLYNVPLTLIFEVAKARSVRAKQGKQQLPVRVTDGNIYVQAVPNGQPFTLTWK